MTPSRPARPVPSAATTTPATPTTPIAPPSPASSATPATATHRTATHEPATHGPAGYDRRRFLGTAAAGAFGAALTAAVPSSARATTAGTTSTEAATAGPRRGARAAATASEPWGRLEPVAENAWALVSTPLNDHPEARRTLCNGGIIAGTDGVLVVEAFGSREGAAWISDEALRLTGRRPTHVVLTHYHGDHVSGGAGYLLSGTAPALLATHTTRRLMAEQDAALPQDRTEARGVLLPDVVLPDEVSREIDLGGRTVRLTGRLGHTPSDLVLAVDDVVYPGDLIWNGMFPNYMDAIPSRLSHHVRALRDEGAARYVSGHGTIAGPADLDRYIDLLDHVEEAARTAIGAGLPLEEAAADYAVPDGLGDWHMFSPRYPEVAFRAWARELDGSEEAS